MENKLKEANEAVLNYAVSAMTRIVELNQKLLTEYVELTKNVANMIPGVSAFTETFKK